MHLQPPLLPRLPSRQMGPAQLVSIQHMADREALCVYHGLKRTRESIRFSKVWRSCVLMAALLVHQVRRPEILRTGDLVLSRHGLMSRRGIAKVCLTKSS